MGAVEHMMASARFGGALSAVLQLVYFGQLEQSCAQIVALAVASSEAIDVGVQPKAVIGHSQPLNPM
jgi:hypothetical protein